MQRRAGVEDMADQVGAGILDTVPPGARRFLATQRFAVASTIDKDGRVWASALAGEPGFLTGVDSQLVRIVPQPIAEDPLLSNLKVRPELGLLVLDPTTRQRMRFNGRGLVTDGDLFLLVKQVYGNCPKYIQKRRLRTEAVATTVGKAAVSTSLSETQRSWIEAADTFFIASFHPEGGADASHRGGLPGFVAVQSPSRLVFPDYPGNAMFNTLGNLSAYPKAGLLFVNFENGDVLQLAGQVRIDDDFAVHVDIAEVRETKHAIALRYDFVEYSPTNPRVVTPRRARHPKR